jgi:uncharacterized protein with von Willebrand factor type A (vWA) domain
LKLSQSSERTAIEYNRANVSEALDKVALFDANYGGTEIFEPLDYAIEILSQERKETRIFLLTDGDVSN